MAAVWGALQFLAWPRAQPWYSAAVARAADAALGLIERGERVSRVRADGPLVQIYSELHERAGPTTALRADVLHFYLVLYASVFLVFPSLRPRRRAALLAASLAALFLFHVLVILIDVERLYAVEMVAVSERNYTDTERWLWEWLSSTTVNFAVQLLPAAALALLFVSHGGFGRGPAQPAEGSAPAPRRRWPLAGCAAALAALACGAGYTHLEKVRARQAEKQCMIGFRELQAGAAARAADLFRQALARKPRFPEARDGLGQALTLQGRHAEAAEELRASIALSPGRPQSHLHLGNVLFAMEDFPGAMAEFQAALGLKPDHREALFNMAMTMKRLGRRDEAEQYLRQVLQISPDYSEALFEISASMIASRRACGALPYLRRLDDLDPASQRADLVRRTIADLEGSCAGRATRPTP